MCSWVGKHIFPMICVPLHKKHKSLAICVLLSKKNKSLVVGVPLHGKHMSIVKCVSLTKETHIPSDMCSTTQETHIHSEMCFIIMSDVLNVMCSRTQETHITRDMCYLLRKPKSLVICAPLPGKHIRAIYTRENKPRLTIAAAYIRRERNHLYEYGLYQTRTARINGSRLSSRPDRSNDDVVCFGASFWGNCVCISQQWLGRAKKLNDWLWPVKNAVFFTVFFILNCLFGQDWCWVLM